MATIQIAAEVQPHVRLESLHFASVRVAPRLGRLSLDLEEAADQARRRFQGLELSSVAAIRDVRALYHATGTDPTKRRPSSEALLRRALQGKPMPVINSLVDCINFFSLAELVPVGLYDEARIQGAIRCRLGRADEPYEAIGREAFGVAGRMILADDRGPFGSPTSDSTRTMVTLETARALAVIFWPASRSDGSSKLLRDLVGRYCSS